MSAGDADFGPVLAYPVGQLQGEQLARRPFGSWADFDFPFLCLSFARVRVCCK